jgi:hypothetical protein
MNESIAYSDAVRIASSPSTVSEAKSFFSEIAPVVLLNSLIPVVIFIGVTLIWSIYRSHKYKKLWNNDDFIIGLLVMVISVLGMFALSPYILFGLV